MGANMQFVAKRSGELVPFDKQKIVAAIEKAMADTPTGVDTVLSVRIADEIASKTEDLSVEEIQDILNPPTIFFGITNPSVIKIRIFIPKHFSL